MKLTLDIETFSRVDLKTAGLYRYAEDESTDLLCACWAYDDGPVNAWIPSADQAFLNDLQFEYAWGALYQGPKTPTELLGFLELYQSIQTTTVHSWNAAFERAVLNGPAGRRYGFPKLEIKQMRCSMARARYCSLPGSLEAAANELNTAVKKDLDGVNAMRYLCKPRKDGTRPTIKDERDRFLKLIPYCAVDVGAERCVEAALPEMSPKEQRVWELDQLINDRGVLVDLKALDDLEYLIDEYKKQLAVKCKELTGIGPTQNAQLAAWIRANGWPGLENLQADTVRKMQLDPAVPQNVKTVIALYSTYNMKAVSKFAAIRKAVCKDGRIRGMLLYHGAGTGRWSSLIVQLHNLFRPVIDDADSAIEAARARDLDWIRALYPGIDPMKVIASCVRGLLIAKEGHELVFPDFSGIESRWLAWMFGEEWKLDAYRAYDRGEGVKPYAVVYGRTFGVDPATVTKPQMLIGKVLDLSMGYEGGVGAFGKMAKTYRLDLAALLPVWPTLPVAFRVAADQHYGDPIYKAKATGLSKEVWTVCEALKLMWRDAHPHTAQGWKDLKFAATHAVLNPGSMYGAARNRILFKMESHFLVMRLPSGRRIRYFRPRMDDGVLHYRGVDTATRIYGDTTTYGGKLCENQAQGGCRDLLVDAMLDFEEAGNQLIMHVHDEPVMEVPVGTLSGSQMESIMCVTHKWAEGVPLSIEFDDAVSLSDSCKDPWAEHFPLAIEGHRGKRYRK